MYVRLMGSLVRSLSAAEACRELFDSYPLAVTPINRDGTVRSMVLMVRDCDDAAFFELTRNLGWGEPIYSLCSWGGDDVIDFDADSAPAPPELVTEAVTCGIPIPRHGSVWGWRNGDSVSALITVHADFSPGHPEPHWAVMPRAGAPRAEWPPFTGEPLLGPWFWSYHRDGRIASLVGLIARNPDTVFWTSAEASPGRGFCVVAHDIKSPEGYVMPHGRYVYYRMLLSGNPSPSLDTVLSGTGLVDLAPRLRRLENDN